MVTRLIFVRHGHVHNPQAVVYGRLPGFHLSELGQRQAQAAAEALRATPLRALFSSPMLRAQETAACIQAHHPNLPLLTEPLINEIHIPLEGHPLSAAAARDWDLYTGSGPEYEQPADIMARVRQFIARVRREYAGQTVAAVSHGDVIAFITLWAGGAPLVAEQKHTLDRLWGMADNYPKPASLTTFTFADDAPDALPQVTYLRPYGEELQVPTNAADTPR